MLGESLSEFLFQFELSIYGFARMLLLDVGLWKDIYF
jgi:hypothetical protein